MTQLHRFDLESHKWSKVVGAPPPSSRSSTKGKLKQQSSGGWKAARKLPKGARPPKLANQAAGWAQDGKLVVWSPRRHVNTNSNTNTNTNLKRGGRINMVPAQAR